MSILSKIFKTVIYTIIIILSLVGVYFVVNGGGQAFITAIQISGFPQFVVDFFVGIWNGVLALFS